MKKHEKKTSEFLYPSENTLKSRDNSVGITARLWAGQLGI
jgi:hypothetical protein